jgi:hypothetical protein
MTLDELRSTVSGPVLEPGDPGFEEEVTGQNLAMHNVPDVVIGITSADDAAAAVGYAREHGLQVHIQATGHGAHEPITGGMLVTTKRLDGLAIDEANRIATIGAGMRWKAVIEAADPFGLAPITGSSTNVGVVGYLLGGGLGPLGRSHGFSSDYVHGFTLVTPTGDIVEVGPDEHADLFWALRGGKLGLGIVTSVRVELVPMPELYAGSLAFHGDDIEPAYRAWAAFTATAPDDVTTSAALMHFPPLPFIPEVFRGKDILMLRFARPGDAATGEQLAAPLRSAAPVYLDNLGPMARKDVGLIHNDPSDPGPGWARGALLDHIDDGFVDTLFAQAGPGVRTPLMIAEVRHLGGRTRIAPEGGDAVGGRHAGFALSIIGAPDPSLFETVLPGATDGFLAALAPWLSPEMNANYGVSPNLWSAIWPGTTGERLVEIRENGDPDGIFAYRPVA